MAVFRIDFQQIEKRRGIDVKAWVEG